VSEQLATDAELLAVVLDAQANAAREQYRQLTALAELNARNVPGTLGYRSLADLISAQLRCDLAMARRLARAVERFGARRSLIGEALEPLHPATAIALADTQISPEHAAVIAETVESIPEPKRAEHTQQVETTLLEQARTLNPGRIRQLGQRILAHLDPDAPSPDEQHQQRVAVQPVADASWKRGALVLRDGHRVDRARAALFEVPAVRVVEAVLVLPPAIGRE